MNSGGEMKIRNGFVSNSSSSSFIFAFKELPSIEELREKIGNVSDWNYNDVTDVAIEQLYNELHDPSHLISEENAVEEAMYQYWRGDKGKFISTITGQVYNLGKGKDKYVIISVDDHGEGYSALESGEYFDEFPNIKLNNH